MKKYNFFILVFWLVIVIVLFAVSRTAKAEEFARYIKNFNISKSTVVNIHTNTAGYIKYKLKKGTYEIDIREVTQSTVMLNDGLESNNGKHYDPLIIESYHYKFIVDVKTTLTLKQGFKTSNRSAKFKVTIKKIGD
jgi:hypothetical protein